MTHLAREQVSKASTHIHTSGLIIFAQTSSSGGETNPPSPPYQPNNREDGCWSKFLFSLQTTRGVFRETVARNMGQTLWLRGSRLAVLDKYAHVLQEYDDRELRELVEAAPVAVVQVVTEGL